MKKNIYFSSFFCLFTVMFSNYSIGAGSYNTISLGYSTGIVKDYYTSFHGVNVKYRYEPYAKYSIPFGMIGSICYVEKSFFQSKGHDYSRDRYHSFAGGISYRFNNWLSFYNLIGFERCTFTHVHRLRNKLSYRKKSMIYGVGAQIHLVEKFSIDLNCEGGYVDNKNTVYVGIGLGYAY